MTDEIIGNGIRKDLVGEYAMKSERRDRQIEERIKRLRIERLNHLRNQCSGAWYASSYELQALFHELYLNRQNNETAI